MADTSYVTKGELEAVLKSIVDNKETFKGTETIWGSAEKFPGAYLGKTTESGHEEALQHAIVSLAQGNNRAADLLLAQMYVTLANTNAETQQRLRHTENMMNVQQLQAYQGIEHSRHLLAKLDFDVEEGVGKGKLVESAAPGTGIIAALAAAIAAELAKKD